MRSKGPDGHPLTHTNDPLSSAVTARNHPETHPKPITSVHKQTWLCAHGPLQTPSAALHVKWIRVVTISFSRCWAFFFPSHFKIGKRFLALKLYEHRQAYKNSPPAAA